MNYKFRQEAYWKGNREWNRGMDESLPAEERVQAFREACGWYEMSIHPDIAEWAYKNWKAMELGQPPIDYFEREAEAVRELKRRDANAQAAGLVFDAACRAGFDGSRLDPDRIIKMNEWLWQMACKAGVLQIPVDLQSVTRRKETA